MTQTQTPDDLGRARVLHLDCCCAPEAKTRFARGDQSLYMCGHHTAQHQNRLTLEGWATFRLLR